MTMSCVPTKPEDSANYNFLVKFVFVLAVAMIIWSMSCAKVGPGYQTDHGYVAARVHVTWPNMSQCFGGASGGA